VLRQAHLDSGETLAAINVHVSAGALCKAPKEIRKRIRREVANPAPRRSIVRHFTRTFRICRTRQLAARQLIQNPY
jgi:hypothetical protein